MTFFDAIRTGFRNYAEFTGRARRPEFWWWVLFTALVSALIGAIPVPNFQFADGTVLFTPAFAPLWHVAVLLPSLAVTVRRLRDAGYHWGHIFWMFLPVAGIIILAVLGAQPSQQTRPAEPSIASGAADAQP